jgi:hypothetical protein
MSSKSWNLGMARAGRGRTMLQIPMHCYQYSKWEEVMRASVAKGIDRFLSSQGHRAGYAFVDTNRLRTSLTVLFGNTDRLLIQALDAYAHAYGQAANTEAGFDLNMVGQQMVIGDPPNDHVIFFATMRAEACEHLLRIDVNGFFKALTRIRRDRLLAKGFSGRIPRSESLMDLLCAALSYTTNTIGMSTPADIVDRVVEARLARFVVAPDADVGVSNYCVSD